MQTLASAGHQVLVLSDNSRYPDREQRYQPADLRGVTIIRIDIPSPLAGIQSFLSYLRTIILSPATIFKVANWWSADVIHVQGLQFSVGALIASKLQDVPLILEFKQPFPVALRLALRRRDMGVLGRLLVAFVVDFFTSVEVLMCLCASSVICISDEEKTRLVRLGVPTKKVLDIGHPPRFGELLVKQTPGRIYPRPTVVYAGAVEDPEKGIDLLLEAFSYLLKDLPTARLIIAGDGSSRRKLEAQARELSISAKVNFLGWLEAADVFDVIRAADVAVIPHRISTMPAKLFTYMHCGTPIVASDFPGVRGIILESRCGELFRAGDAKDLSSALKRILTDESLRHELSSNAERAARQRYNWEHESRKLLEIYSKLG